METVHGMARCVHFGFFTLRMVNKLLTNHIQRPFKALFSAYINPGQQHRTKMHGELRSEHFQRLKCSTEHSSRETLAESTRECEPSRHKRTWPLDRGRSTIPQLLKGAGRDPTAARDKQKPVSSASSGKRIIRLWPSVSFKVGHWWMFWEKCSSAEARSNKMHSICEQRCLMSPKLMLAMAS